MPILDEVANINDKAVLIVEQAAVGTEQKPAAANSVTPLRPGMTGLQAPQFITSDEILGESYDEGEDIFTGFNLGDGRLPTYVKPNGLGIVPEVGILFKLLFGKQAVTAGTSVVYTLRSPSDDEVVATAWHRRGHTVSRYIDLYVSGATFTISATKDGQGLLQAEWRLGYLRELQTVSDTVKTARLVNAAGILAVDTPKNLYDGGYVTIKGDDNTGAGFKITGVAATGFTPMPTAGVPALEVGDAIRPWWPGGSRRGTILASRRGVASWGAGYPDLPIKTFSISMELNPTETEPVMQATGADYPKGYGFGTRQVTFQGTVDWTPAYETFRRRANDADKLDFSVEVGTVAGRKVKFELNEAQILVPEVQDGTTNEILSFSGKANPTVGNDTVQVSFL